jgi:hypothetical protein
MYLLYLRTYVPTILTYIFTYIYICTYLILFTYLVIKGTTQGSKIWGISILKENTIKIVKN